MCNKSDFFVTRFSDDDECGLTDNCHENATCTNTDGSFTCTCLPGYSGNGLSCIGKIGGGKISLVLNSLYLIMYARNEYQRHFKYMST